MTIQFTTQINKIVPTFSLDNETVAMTQNKIENPNENLFKYLEEKTKQKLYPVSHWWVTRVYRTTSESPPIKWQPYDSACYGTMQDLEGGFIEWIDYLGKNTDYTGFKVCTMKLDMLNGTSEVAVQFSKEHFQPKEKIFINGPKKKPFPAKASKHYQK